MYCLRSHAVLAVFIVTVAMNLGPKVLVEGRDGDGRGHHRLGKQGKYTRGGREEYDGDDKGSVLCVYSFHPIVANDTRPVHKVIADGRPNAAALLASVPALGAVSLLQIEKCALGNVHEVGHGSGEDADKGDEDPALGAIKPCCKPAPNVLATAESLDAERISYAVVDPVGRGELIVPHAVVLEERWQRRLHAVLQRSTPAPLAQRRH
jgi:hypothetical protein